MANPVPRHDAFSNSYPTVPDSTAILERFFTQDQCQSLQRLLLVQQSYLFRCLYEMETHLELTVEELRKKLAKTEGQTTRLLLLTETTREGLITLSRKIDDIDSHQRRKRKRTYTASSTYESEYTTKQTKNLSSPVCSDGSTLLAGSPKDASNNVSGSFPKALFAPIDYRLNCVSDPSTSISQAPQVVQDFASAPAVSSSLSPVKRWIGPGPDHGATSGPVPDQGVQGPEPALPATSSAQEASQPNLPQNQEPESELEQGTEPEPQRFQSHPQFPSLSPEDMDITTSDEQARPPSRGAEQEDEDEDEEIVLMQLINATPFSASRPPTPLDRETLCVDTPDATTPPGSPFAQLPSIQLPSSSIPTPLRPLSPPSVQSQPHTSSPSPVHAEITQALEPASVETKLEAQEPAPLTLELKEVEPYFWDLTRSLSPLSDLSDTESIVDYAEKERDSQMGGPRKVKQESEPISGLDGVAPSDASSKSVVVKLEEKRSKKPLKDVERKKPRRKRSNKRVDGKKDVAEQKKKSLKGQDKSAAKKRVRKQRVNWPEAYEGDEEDGFYKKLIECDMCSCWYHYGCAGIVPEDDRLDSSEIFVCPVCITLGENKLQGRLTCSRPDCRRSEQPGEYYVSGIAGRKLRYDESGNVKFLYLVKWDGYSVADATWEFEDVIPDPQHLIDKFEEACQRENLPLDSSEPILLQEAVAVGWRHVLEFTDPPGKQMPLAQHTRSQKNGYRILIPIPTSHLTKQEDE